MLQKKSLAFIFGFFGTKKGHFTGTASFFGGWGQAPLGKCFLVLFGFLTPPLPPPPPF